MRWKLILGAGLAAVAAGCEVDLANVEAVFGNSGAPKVLAKPTKVRAYRLAGQSFYREKVAEYETTAGPIDVSDELARQTATLLLDPKSYLWNSANSCEPVYGVRLAFTQGDKTVDVVFCFECDILTVYYQGRAVGGEDFDNIRPQLVEIMKQIFPDDTSIQTLKPNG